MCESFVEAINTFVSDIFSESGISLSDAESRVFERFRLISQKFLSNFYLIKQMKNWMNLLSKNFTHPKTSGLFSFRIFLTPTVLCINRQ